MEVTTLKGRLPDEFIESVSRRGIKLLNPPQAAAVSHGLLDGESLVVAAPTASGKTLIAEMAIIRCILSKRMKALYVAPMRALVSEKYHEFREQYPYLRIAMSIGDMDSADQWLASNDLILVSTEKLDSLMRHGADWIGRVGCIVFDEVHTLGDPSRGPTLELVITKLASTTSAQLLALSATVGNAGEIAQWLKAGLVQSDYRPVSLRKGIVFDGKVHYAPPDAKKAGEETLLGTSKAGEGRVVEDTLERQKQVLLFYSTRRNAVAGAHRLSQITERKLTETERQKLQKVADTIEGVLERPTAQCLELSGLVRKGTAFHHAGLLNAQRGIIEEAFKSNIIKAICSTTTLGLGVNMPAHTVLVRDTSRYSGEGGSGSISINEVLQLMGRAGRPKYDTEGRALISASTREKVEELKNRYLLSEPEPVDSGLGIAAMMRAHILAFIASDFLNTTDSIKHFIGKTFYAFQYGNTRHIYSIVESVIEELTEWEMITSAAGTLRATRIGKRVSDLYIDPLSARWIISCLQNETDLIGSLYMISNTLEMRPYPKPTEEAYEGYVLYRQMVRNSAALYETERNDFGYYDPVAPFATAMMLNDWIEEKREDEIMKRYRITPGHIYTKLASADWMLYSSVELAHLMKKSAKEIIDLRVRVHYGIKEELLDLVRLEQIGRVRARLLHMNGIRRVSQIGENREKVISLLGREIAQKVFKQVGLQ
jgi:helicase